MSNTATYTIGLDTPISALTPRQLFEMMSEWQSEHGAVREREQVADRSERGWYVNSVAELAEILGTSESTIYRMRGEGVLDDCISQYGRWVMIDVNKVLDVFRLSNRRKNKRKRG